LLSLKRVLPHPINHLVRKDAFETATRRDHAAQGSLSEVLSRNRPQIVVSALAVVARGALYASRVSEGAPQVVYSASLEVVEADSQDSLVVNVDTARGTGCLGRWTS
jgi:hypothetical protein